MLCVPSTGPSPLLSLPTFLAPASPESTSTYHIPAVLACLPPRPSEIPRRTDNAHLGLSIKSVHLVGPHRGLTACCPELLFPECVGSSLPGLPCPVGPISASPPSRPPTPGFLKCEAGCRVFPKTLTMNSQGKNAAHLPSLSEGWSTVTDRPLLHTWIL